MQTAELAPVYYLVPKMRNAGQACYYLKSLVMVYYLTKDLPFDKDFVLTTESNIWPRLGNPISVNLPKGGYEITPLSGACNDWGSSNWTWHMRTSKGDLGGEYSLEAETFGGWIDTPAEAFNSVKGERLNFNWDGGFFKMWLPSNDSPPNNNSGSIKVNVKKIKEAL
jgi:hypothetical protein